MMDIDRFDNVYSVGDTIVGGIVLTRKFNPDGILLWERSYRPEFAVKATWVAADPNGGAYVVGYKWTGSNQSAIGYFVLRYDADGNLVWSDISDGCAAQAVRAVADRRRQRLCDRRPLRRRQLHDRHREILARRAAVGLPGGQSERQPVSPARPCRPAFTCPTTAARSPPRARAGTTTTCCPATSPGSSASRTFATIPSTPPPSRSTTRARCISATAWPAAPGMQITKYSATGVVQWTNVYPQGDYIYRLALDSLGNVIATGPDYSTYYANWVTMKVAPNGALLWSATFDALTATTRSRRSSRSIPSTTSMSRAMGGPEVVAANGSQLSCAWSR